MTNELRETIRLEDQADLYAAACDFGNAAALMKQVNTIRARVFGRLDPNELRRRTHEALKEQL